MSHSLPLLLLLTLLASTLALAGAPSVVVSDVHLGDPENPIPWLAPTVPILPLENRLLIRPDGQAVAYIDSNRRARLRFTYEDDPGPWYDFIPWGEFSPDGERWAYVGFLDEEAYVHLDGERFGPYEKVTPDLRFRDVGGKRARLYYVAREEGESGLYVDGERVEEGVGDAFAVDAEGRLLRSKLRRNGAVIDYKVDTSRVYDEVADCRFDPAGTRYACRTRDGERWRYVVSGAEQSPYRKVDGFVFAGDGERYAYVAWDEGEVIVVDSGKEAGRYPDGGRHVGLMERPVFSPDGRRLAWAVGEAKNRASVYLDGKRGASFRSIGDDTLVFSADSSKLFFLAQSSAGVSVVVHGEGSRTAPVRWRDGIRPPAISPDGKHTVFSTGAKGKKAGRTLLVVDGRPEVLKEQFAADLRLGPFEWLDERTFRYFALRKGGVRRVTRRLVD